MKAARFYGKHRLVVEDVPAREPEANEIKIRVKMCGICGTDVHIFEGDKGSAEVNPPVILGHELSGDVVSVGSNITRFKVGDRVSVDPNSYCGKCYYCAKGKKHLCENMLGMGTAVDGGFAEFVTVPEELVFPVAPNVSYEAAAMIEPISCCLHGMDLTDVRLGDTVMIVGTGNIGLIMLQLCRHAGAARIVAVEPNEKRRKKALEMGADVAIDPIHDDTEKVLRENQVCYIDKVIDCAGRTDTAEYCVKYAGRGATVMLFGLTGPDDEMRLKPFEVFQKELTIKGSFVNPNAFERAGRLLANGVVDVESIITSVVDLDDIQSVFEQRLYAKDGKVLIRTSK